MHMKCDSQTTLKRIGAIDFGSAGYVRIDATANVGEEVALNIASDLIIWLRSMHTKYRQDEECADAG
jgi:hypothetical protein